MDKLEIFYDSVVDLTARAECISVFLGSSSGDGLELPMEASLTFKSAFVSNFCQGIVGGLQKMYGLFDPLLLNVAVKGLPCGSLEEIVEIYGT